MSTPQEQFKILEKMALESGMSKDETSQFLANIIHETGHFKRTRENLKYSAERLMQLFGPRMSMSGKAISARNGYDTLDKWKTIVTGGESAIAEAIYGGVWGAKNLGNINPGDGAKFIGRGYLQLTGRSNYTKIGNALGIDLVNNPELACDPTNSAKIAIHFWNTRGAGERAKAKDYKGARVKVNGGDLGYNDIQLLAKNYLEGKLVV